MHTRNHGRELFSLTQPQFSTLQKECLFLCTPPPFPPLFPIFPHSPHFSSLQRPTSDPPTGKKWHFWAFHTRAFPIFPQKPK